MGAERSRRRAPQRATLLLTVGAALLTSTTPASAWLWAPSSGATRALSGPRGPATVRPVPDKSNEGGLVADKGQLQGRVHRKLMEEQVERGRGGESETQPLDEDFLRCVEYGMPPMGGIGLGIDRMVMLLTGQTTIRDVILFPTMRPEQ